MSKENLDINIKNIDIDTEAAKDNRIAGVVLNEKQLAKYLGTSRYFVTLLRKKYGLKYVIDNFSKALTEATNRHDEDVSFHRGTDGSEIRKLTKNTTYRIQSLLIQAIKWGDKKGYLSDTVTNRITRLPKDPYSELEIPDIENVIQFIDHINQNEQVQMHYKVFINT